MLDFDSLLDTTRNIYIKESTTTTEMSQEKVKEMGDNKMSIDDIDDAVEMVREVEYWTRTAKEAENNPDMNIPAMDSYKRAWQNYKKIVLPLIASMDDFEKKLFDTKLAKTRPYYWWTRV